MSISIGRIGALVQNAIAGSAELRAELAGRDCDLFAAMVAADACRTAVSLPPATAMPPSVATIAPELPPHDPQTGELAPDVRDGPEPTDEGAEDVGATEETVLDRPLEQPDDEPEPEIPDVGREAILALTKRISATLRAPEAHWKDFARGYAPDKVIELMRTAPKNARTIASAERHHPDLFLELEGVFFDGRIAP